MAERIRAVVGGHLRAGLAPGLEVTCSIGVTISRAGEDVAATLGRADAALYRTKSEGRDRVCMD